MRFFRTTTAAAAVLIAGVTQVAAETWEMPTPYPEGNFHTQNIEAFASDVAAATDGALEINIHAGASLFKHPEIKNAVRSGQAQAGEFIISMLANENPIYALDSVPFVATSYADAQRLWEVTKPRLEELLAEQNLLVLFSVPWPPQGLYTGAEVASVDDLRGLKFRAYNQGTERLAQLVGGVPTQVEVPDIPQAFATGRVNAMITSSSTGVNSTAWDFLTHFYNVQAFLPKNIVVVNRDAFEALDAATQTAVRDAAAAAETRGWEMSETDHEAQMALLEQNGIVVGPGSDALNAALKEVGDTMSAEWQATASAEDAAVLEAFRN